MSYQKQEKLAKSILTHNKEIIAVEKVTRAGATTSLISQAIDAKLKVAFFAPTHEIGKETVKKATNYALRKGAKILYIKSYKETCKKLIEQVKENKNLQEMRWMLLPEKCSECKYSNNPKCEVQRNLNCNDWDILVVTYHKLKTLIQSSANSEISRNLLAKITKTDVAIFDEYTHGLLCMTPSVNVTEAECEKLHDMTIYTNSTILVNAASFAFDAYEAGSKLRPGAGELFSNPLSSKDFFVLTNNFSALWKRITDLTASGHDTKFVQSLAPVASYKELFIHKDRKNNITLRPMEPIEEGLSFINQFIDEYTQAGRLSILVDSHLPDFELEKHFKTKLEYFPWGDPNDTNSHIAYFCDSRTLYYETMQHSNAQEYLQRAITEICAYHAKGNAENFKDILIVCMNTSVSNKVKKWRAEGLIPNVPDANITWYRSKITRGVRFNGTVQIMLGGPYIPVVAYHHKFILKQDKSNSAKAWNYAFRKSNMVSEHINASTRVKDPEGKRDSFVYCLGMTKSQVESLLDWNGHIYTSGAAKRPYVFGCLTTGTTAKDMLQATELFQSRHLISEPQKHITYLMKLLKAHEYFKAQGHTEAVPFSRIFRDKTTEAIEAVEKNSAFIEKLGVNVKAFNNGGMSLEFQDNRNMLIEYIAGSCRLENLAEGF